MRGRVVQVALGALLLAGCGRLDELQTTVPSSEWCQQRPCADLGGVVLAEPTSTVHVGMNAWLAFVVFVVGRHLRDLDAEAGTLGS